MVIQTKSVEFMPFLLSLFVFLNSTTWTIYAGVPETDLYILVSTLCNSVLVKTCYTCFGASQLLCECVRMGDLVYECYSHISFSCTAKHSLKPYSICRFRMDLDCYWGQHSSSCTRCTADQLHGSHPFHLSVTNWQWRPHPSLLLLQIARQIGP